MLAASRRDTPLVRALARPGGLALVDIPPAQKHGGQPEIRRAPQIVPTYGRLQAQASRPPNLGIDLRQLMQPDIRTNCTHYVKTIWEEVSTIAHHFFYIADNIKEKNEFENAKPDHLLAAGKISVYEIMLLP